MSYIYFCKFKRHNSSNRVYNHFLIVFHAIYAEIAVIVTTNKYTPVQNLPQIRNRHSEENACCSNNAIPIRDVMFNFN